jgi:hypothetical protein
VKLIQDRNNGLLVENQNFKKLAQMDLMIEDHDLYPVCEQRSQASTVSLENIGYQWLKYLKLM